VNQKTHIAGGWHEMALVKRLLSAIAFSLSIATFMTPADVTEAGPI